MDFEKLIKAYNGDLSPEICLYILTSYEEIFNKKINQNCSSCIRDAAIQIICKMNNSKKYMLDARFCVEINKQIYTQGTLSDELAEKFLHENPDQKYKFKKLPRIRTKSTANNAKSC